MRFLRGFGRFWYDFVIGDDWKIAFAVALVMVVGAVLAAAAILPSHVLAPLLGVGLLGVFVVAVLVDVRR
jgi:hypothetical protein